MATTDLGACEWFVWDLRRSNLIDRGQLDQVISDFLKRQPRAEPPAMAQFLVEKGILSQFQAERLLQGKTQGLVLGPYTLMDALGSGSMGTVYKAQSKNDNKWYAVKVLPRRSMWNVRIARRQVRAFEQCKHPAVVPFVDVGTAGGTHYLAWPFVEGEGLDTMVQRQGKLAPGLAALYALQTAEGLDVCHKQNLVHGLLKPSNLMVGTDQQVRILDFGIGSLLAESEGESLVDTMSTANSLTSGLDCASPESILEPTLRTAAGDQYSMGCVMYYFLTGNYPFPEGTAVEKMQAHQHKQPTPVREVSPEVPEALAAIVERLMAKTPEERFPSMTEVIEALQPLASSSAIAARLAARSSAAAGGMARPAQAAPARPMAAPFSSDNARPGMPSPREIPTRSGRPAAAQTPPQVPRQPLPPGGLPTRESFRGRGPGSSMPSHTPKPQPVPRLIPRDYSIDRSSDSSSGLEERLGPLGLIILALLGAGLTFVVAWLFMPGR